ncbi:MAG TPA: response regulator transcription factor [Geomonas sp.]|nr:response regulator transcription factor [Geomonas sp.]
MKIRILLADHHALIRECLCSILAQVADFQVVAQTGKGIDALDLARQLVPDVVVMEIGLLNLDGIEATRRMVSAALPVRVLILSMHPGKNYVLEALKAGAAGYVLKSCLSLEIFQAIRAVAAGETFVSEELQLPVGAPAPQRFASLLLTDRERQILVLLARGAKIIEIAVALDISPKTAETHRTHLMKKLNLKNIAELTRYAIREGLLQLE